MVKTYKDLNKVFPFDFYLSLNQAINGEMKLVTANPAFTLMFDDEMKDIPEMSCLKNRINFFELIQKMDEDTITEEMFEQGYKTIIEGDIPFYSIIPAINTDIASQLYTQTEATEELAEKGIEKMFSMNENIPVNELVAIQVQLFDENENPLIGPDLETPKPCMEIYDERLVMQFISQEGTHFWASKQFKWLEKLKEKYQQAEKENE